MIDILHPAMYKSRNAANSEQRIVTPTSPASSTSTLKASSRSWNTASKASGPSTARSRGQQARRYSIESAVSSSTKYNYVPRLPSSRPSERALALREHEQRRSIAASTRKGLSNARVSQQPKAGQRQSHKPLLGGLYFSDLVVVAFFYAINLLRTCGIAELFDVAFKAVAYVFTRLPFDFYHRWSLSRTPPDFTPPLVSSQRRILARDAPTLPSLHADAYSHELASSAMVTTSEDEASEQDDGDAQLSHFHHLVILLVKFACTSFPHLIPRVLFAEETIGPLVRWRTGGGAAGIVREFSGPAKSPSDSSAPKSDQTAKPAFRAFWIGADAHVPVDVRRSNDRARSATTLLYLHGGGFSLGSVAFYAEALIRIVTKVCRIEDRNHDARCVAVEYDLSPTSRFPGPLLQCLRCYAHLIEVEGIAPSSITIAGDSAGGNLAMAMLLCLDGQAIGDPNLAERDWSKLPMPGRAVLISPWADLRPSASIAFAPLRDPESQQQKRAAAAGPESVSNNRVSVWTEAMAQYEWDYVAAEALMHFAQLYSGVLKTPRRVRGPMGWVANFCAIIAGDSPDLQPESSKTAPLRLLRLLTSPPRRLVRAAHSILTEPLLDRTTYSTTTASKSLSTSTPSGGAMDPIFPKNERKSDPVPTPSDLFLPVWDTDKLDPQQRNDADFCAAAEQLENSKLINPAIGDWSRIRLEHGMLVVWGDRERLADDIETWVKGVRTAQDASKHNTWPTSQFDDKPGQDENPILMRRSTSADGPTIQERRAASQSPARRAESLPAREWVCTAVEHGPAGVHAWPFVSMYLAGTEFEREKGLEIIASFIAQPFPSPASTNPATPLLPAATPLSFKLPSDSEDLDVAPSHAPAMFNAVSPAGSMPSDMGFSDSQSERDYMFNAPSNDGSNEWDQEAQNELGLQGTYPHETIWPSATPTPSTGMGTPLDGSDSEASFDDEALRVGLGLAADSRSSHIDMEPVHLHHVGHRGVTPTPETVGRSANKPQRSDVDNARTRLDHVQRPRHVDVGLGRSLAEMEALDPKSSATSPVHPRSPTWTDAGSESASTDPVAALEALDSDDPYFHPSPYSALSYVDDEIPMDIGYYGLSHYTTLRPEGLSDIAEEDSQMDLSSILSNGGGVSGARSPAYTDEGLSPFESTSPTVSANRSRYTGATALDMQRLRQALQERERQYQQRFVRPTPQTAAIDEAELSSASQQQEPDTEGRDMSIVTDSDPGSDERKRQPLPTFATTPDGWHAQSGATSPTSSVKDVWW